MVRTGMGVGGIIRIVVIVTLTIKMVCTSAYADDTNAPITILTPPGGQYNSSQDISLACSDSGILRGGAIQGTPLNLTNVVSTFAGSRSRDGVGSAARLTPNWVTSDGTNLYVTDDQTIRKIVIATGAVTTLAGSYNASGYIDGVGSAARFNVPAGITTDGTNLYVVDTNNSKIRKIVIASGAVSTLASNVNANDIVIVGGNLYATDGFFKVIRKISTATGVNSILAGQAYVGGSLDGTGTGARFSSPAGIATDGSNLYVTDSANLNIRKIVIATGEVTTIAGNVGVSGSSDGTGTAALFGNPYGISSDGTNLYVADSANKTIRMIIIATGEVTTLAGNAGVGGSTDGSGTSALFKSPTGITCNGTHLFVADYSNYTIRKIEISSGSVTTLAGSPAPWPDTSGSNDGTASEARFSWPFGITSDRENIYVADYRNSTIRKVNIATGMVTTIAGKAGALGATEGIGSVAAFRYPRGITTDGSNLYVADSWNHTIRKIVLATGEVFTLAGSAGVSGMTDGIGSAARFDDPTGITTDGTTLFVAEASNNNRIRKVVIATGEVTSIVLASGSHSQYTSDGSNAPGITTDGAFLYIADNADDVIKKVDLSSGAVTILAGGGSTIDGIGSAASFAYPSGITTDGTNLYVADTGRNTIRKIIIATGEVSTLAGSAGQNGDADGTGSAARFNAPNGITHDGTHLYISDYLNSTIRKIAGTPRSASGCNSTYYCLGSNCTPAATYVSPLPISASQTIRYYSMDNAGNRETVNEAHYSITYTISGSVKTSSGQGIAGISFSGANCTISDSSGSYTCTVDSIWTGTISPVLAGFSFSPASRNYNSILTNQTNQNYTSASVPPPPGSITTVPGNGRVTISWTNVSGATSYNLYYSRNPGVTKATGTKRSGVTSPYIVTSLTNGTPYYFVVTAVNANGEAVESGQVSAIPFLPPTGRLDMASLYYKDDAGREISYDFSSGAVSNNSIDLPASAILNRPQLEANAIYGWGNTWPGDLSLSLNTSAKVCTLLTHSDAYVALGSSDGDGYGGSSTNWQFKTSLKNFVSSSPGSLSFSVGAGSSSPAISPSIDAGWFTGWHEGTYYDNVFYLNASIEDDFNSSNSWTSDTTLLYGIDPATTTADFSVEVQNGQTFIASYRLNNGQWVELGRHTLSSGTMSSFGDVLPYVDISAINGSSVTLNGLAVAGGPIAVAAGDTASYVATAFWNDGTSSAVTPGWSISPTTYASINPSTGVLTTLAVTGNQSITVTATYTYNGVTLTATRVVTIVGVPANYGLTFTLSGTGTGSVNSDPSGLIACTWPPQAGICSSIQSAGTSLTLIASPGGDSSFSSWGGACNSCSGLSCLVTIDSDKSCSTAFDILPLVRIAGPTYFASLVTAYGALQDNAPATVLARDMVLSGDVDFNRNIALTLLGGYAAGFGSVVDFTSIHGILTVSRGSLLVEKVMVK